ncbi:uncharacterized protein HaLaN_22080 [Haematococcus lacustris]|uniref:Uncharacterized protein n=1 Tax=Haematococcus lacustris TaxID=44745 RepID=A0A699ZT09_HAELA|nr:uncharacterized protein HaLaN_22080 [Haematococcus lacustris]
MLKGLFSKTEAEPQAANSEGAEQHHHQQHRHPPVPYVAHRVLVNSAFYFTWVPYCVLIAAKDSRSEESLFFGLAFSGWSVLFNGGYLACRSCGSRKRELPYILDAALAVYFAVYLAVHEARPEYRADLQKYTMQPPMSILCAAPAAPAVPNLEAWAAPSFRCVCDQLAAAWTLAEALTALLSLAPLLTGQNTGMAGLNIAFNYVWPYLSLLAMIGLTRWLPGNRRERGPAAVEPCGDEACSTTGNGGGLESRSTRVLPMCASTGMKCCGLATACRFNH